MNICIDGFAATSLKGTGHHTYTKNLIEGLLESYPQPQYSLLWQGEDLSGKWKRHRLVCDNLELDRINNNLKDLEQYLSENRISLFHSPNNGFSIPEKKVCKYVITVHDLIAKTRAELADDSYKRKYDQVFPYAAQKADKIIAVSEFIKGELEDLFAIKPEKIQVVYPWVDNVHELGMSGSREHLKRKHGIDFDYILSIGSIHPRKNLATLIRAFKSSDLYKEGIKLIIAGSGAGKRQSHYLQLRALAEKMELSDSVVFLGQVDYEDAMHLYKCSRCMISLSEYEGFSQVLLEAMTIGTPIICGRNSSIEEVAGQAGTYVDLKDLTQIRKALRQLTLYESEEKVEEGLKQSLKFAKDKSLKQIVSVYENTVY